MKLKFVITFMKCFKCVTCQFRNYAPNTETGSFVCSMESSTFVCVCVRARARVYARARACVCARL